MRKALIFIALLTGITHGSNMSLAANQIINSEAMDKCIKKCSNKKNYVKSMNYCRTLCDCFLRETLKMSMEEMMELIEKNQMEATAERIATMCSGRLMPASLRDSCITSCPPGRDCKKSCACLESKVNSLGTDYEVGLFLERASARNSAEHDKYMQFHKDCLTLDKQ